MRAAEDARSKPRHLALLVAVIAAQKPHEGDLDSWHDYGAVERGVPVDQRHLLELAHFGDVATLRRTRVELQDWGYMRFRLRSGQSTVYDVPTCNDDDWVWDATAAVPFGFVRDTRLKPGHVAVYVALSVEAERSRQARWPRDEQGNAQEDAPKYGTECTVTGRRLDALAG